MVRYREEHEVYNNGYKYDLVTSVLDRLGHCTTHRNVQTDSTEKGIMVRLFAETTSSWPPFPSIQLNVKL